MSLIRNIDHHCHQPLLLLLGILEQVSFIAWHQREVNSLHGPLEKRGEWTFSKVQVMYLLLIVGLRWRWACGDDWLWIIIGVIVIAPGAPESSSPSSSSSPPAAPGSEPSPLQDPHCCHLRLQDGPSATPLLLLSVSVHLAFVRMVVVVVVVALEYHVLGLRLIEPLLVRHLLGVRIGCGSPRVLLQAVCLFLSICSKSEESAR
jgi:hypothetical protein